MTAHPEPGIDPSLVVGGVAPASLVVSLASVFFILTVAVVVGLYVVYRRRWKLKPSELVHLSLFVIGAVFSVCKANLLFSTVSINLRILDIDTKWTKITCKRNHFVYLQVILLVTSVIKILLLLLQSGIARTGLSRSRSQVKPYFWL